MRGEGLVPRARGDPGLEPGEGEGASQDEPLPDAPPHPLGFAESASPRTAGRGGKRNTPARWRRHQGVIATSQTAAPSWACTILAGVIAGPWVGGSVGFVSNLVGSNTIDPIAAPYGIVSFAVGFAAGLSRYLNWQRRPSGWVMLWLVCFLLAALMSTPINFLMNGGRTSVGFGGGVYAALKSFHLPNVIAALAGEAAVDFPDKLLTVVGALLIARGRDLVEAVEDAKHYVTEAIRRSLSLGGGHGPVAHDWPLSRESLRV